MAERRAERQPRSRPRSAANGRSAQEIEDASWVMSIDGAGPPIVLLHGLGATARTTWGPVADRLAESFTVVNVDLPGHGASEFHHHDVDFEGLSDELERVLRRRGITDFTLVGHSFGGAVAWRYAAFERDPAATRVVLVDSGGLGKEISVFVRALGWPGASLVFDGLYSRRVTRTLSGLPRSAARRAALTGVAASGAANLRDVVQNLANPLTRTALRHYLSFSLEGRQQRRGPVEDGLTLEQPTLIVWGEDDVILPVRQAHRAHRLLPGSELLVLPGVGHCPPKQSPDAVAEAIARFAAA